MTDYDPFNKPPRKPSGRGGNYVDPPAQHRFKPGQSGNPRGRPKGSISLPNAMVKLLRKRTKVTIAGEIKSLSQSEIIAFQIIQHAAKGDLNFIKFVSQQTQNHPEMQMQAAADDAEKEVLIDNVMELMKALIQTQTQDIQPNPITLPEDVVAASEPVDTGIVVTKFSSPLPTPTPTPAAPIRLPTPKPQFSEEEMKKRQKEAELMQLFAKSPNSEQLIKAYIKEQEAKKRKEND
jgi:hypothetical protein